MFTYFVPLGLLVLAGFALGVLVGRLAWASTRSTIEHKRSGDAVSTDDEPEDGFGSRSVFRRSVPDLPTWRMREVDAIPEPTPRSPLPE